MFPVCENVSAEWVIKLYFYILQEEKREKTFIYSTQNIMSLCNMILTWNIALGWFLTCTHYSLVSYEVIVIVPTQRWHHKALTEQSNQPIVWLLIYLTHWNVSIVPELERSGGVQLKSHDL